MAGRQHDGVGVCVWLQGIAEPPRPTMAGMSTGDIARELAVIHHLCVSHIGELRDQSDRQVSVRPPPVCLT